MMILIKILAVNGKKGKTNFTLPPLSPEENEGGGRGVVR